MMEHKLIKYNENTLDTAATLQVKNWIAASDENQKMYEDVVSIWEQSKFSQQFQQMDKTAAWKKLEQRIQSETSNRRKIIIASTMRWGTAAASIVLILGLYFYHFQSKPQIYTTHASGKNIILKDNSKVVLYSNSQLKVAPDYNKHNRTVILSGNATFKVQHNKEKPFLVHSNELGVEVLGTTFTIYQRNDFITVFVQSGKVKGTYNNQSVIGIANQKIVKNNTSGVLKVTDVRSNIDKIIETQAIRCKNMRIDSLIALIEDVYSIKIRIDSNLVGRKITSTYFTSEPAEQVIENIALTLNVKWDKKNGTYSITQ